jgi:hypothetical protein
MNLPAITNPEQEFATLPRLLLKRISQKLSNCPQDQLYWSPSASQRIQIIKSKMTFTIRLYLGWINDLIGLQSYSRVLRMKVLTMYGTMVMSMIYQVLHLQIALELFGGVRCLRIRIRQVETGIHKAFHLEAHLSSPEYVNNHLITRHR